jgi:hypothetical protein
LAQLAPVQDGQNVDAEQIARPIRLKLQQAREWRRKKHEPAWHMSLAFAAGKHWLTWDRDYRALRRVQDVDPRYRGRELYQADVITEYRTTMLGELGADNDRPELLLQRDDQASEDYQAQVNKAVGWGWDYQWHGDEVLAEVDQLTIDLGTAAVRCRWEPNAGPVKADNVPYQNGRPVLKVADATALFQNGPNPDVTMQQIREGKICWDALSAFNILVPPGVPNERNFPWEAVIRPTLLSEVQETYPAAAGMKEDGDIGTGLGIATTSAGAAEYGSSETRNDRLRDHVWLVTYYERPTGKFPQGRVMVFAGNDLKLIHTDNRLPYQAPDGTWRSGISYFHWWRVTGQFFSRSLVSSMEDGQRMINRRGTQKNEIIDRNMPFMIVDRSSNAKNRDGTPLEFVELEPSERTPVVVTGQGLTDAFNKDIDVLRDDIAHATGIKGPRLGENPANVSTYSQLALINESDQVKREPILAARKLSISHLVEDSVYDIRTYWGPDKQIMLAGDEDQVDAQVFDATKIPPFYIVTTAKGSSKPRTQAAKLKLIEDIATFSLNARTPVPIAWFKDSLEAGEPLALPEQAADDQADKAELENHLMLQGHDVQVTYYDPPNVHIPAHRSAQIQAEMVGDDRAWQTIERHVQQHLTVVAQQAAKTQALQQSGPPPGPPGEPPPPTLPPVDHTPPPEGPPPGPPGSQPLPIGGP